MKRRIAGWMMFGVLSGCGFPKEVNGSSLLLNMQPGPPAFGGKYDFELLGRVTGKSCVTRMVETVAYWVGLSDLSTLSADPLTRSAIAAATFDALSRLAEADSVVLTRVVAQGSGSTRVCATVVGRGIRLTKYAPPRARTREATPPDGDEPEPDEDASTSE